jgi:predicted phage tail protein
LVTESESNPIVQQQEGLKRRQEMSKKILVLALGIVLGGVQAGWAATVSLAWDPNPESDIAGYELHYGTSSKSYTQVQVFGSTATQGTVTGLQDGNTYYFALKAFDTSGNRSGFSNEVWTPVGVLGKPGRPTYTPTP